MKQRKWRVLLSMVLAFCLCLSAVVPVSAAGVGGTDDGSGFGDWLSEMFGGWFGGEDEDQTQDDSLTTYAGNTDSFYRIVHLDCGRKYFSVANIEKLIDTMAQYGYNQLQLAFGNGGCRFLLNDMSLSFDSVTMSSDTVKTNITNGNNSFNGDTRYLTQADMDAIITYANGKNIEIVPMLNMPGHATAIVSGTGYASASGGNLDINNENARNYGYALLKKYVDYFKGKGCKFFHFGSDESGYTGDNMTTFLTGCAKVITNVGMTPRAFNDATYVATMPTSVQITYWHQESGSKTASALANAGYQMINTHGRWYYVIKNAQNSEIGTKYWQGTVNSTPTSVELPVMKAEKMDKKWVGINEYFDGNPGYGSTISDSKGIMFCIWCDASQDSYLTDSDVISENVNYGALYQLEKLAEHYWPEDIKVKPQITLENGLAVPASVVKGTKFTLKADRDVTWSVKSETGAIRISTNSVTGTILISTNSVTGTSVSLEAVDTGTATVTATDGNGLTASSNIEVTADATEATTKNVELKVGESKTFDVASGIVAGDITTKNEYIATANVTEGVAQAAGYKAVTEITSGKKYLIVSCRKDYLLTNNSNGTQLKLSGRPSADSDQYWIINATEAGGSYSGTVCDTVGKYLVIGNGTSSVSNNQNTVTLAYSSQYQCWTIAQNVWITTYYLNQYGGKDATVAGGWTDGISDEGSRWYIYEITEASSGNSTVTITGTGEGDTSVEVGNVTYNIKVTAPETTETKAITYGNSFKLPTNAIVEKIDITSGSGITAADGSVIAGNVDATAVVTAVIKNAGGFVTARYIYNVTVSEIDLGNVNPLSVELWVTNRYAGGTHNGTTYPATAAGHIVSVSAELANGEDGVFLENLVPTSGVDEGSLPLLYWKGTRLSSSNKQTYTGDDMSGSGNDFQKIRYYEDSWQYLNDGKWTNIVSTDQIIAYYMQVYNTSPEIVTAFRDYGGIAGTGGGEYDANWFAGYRGVGTAVVYQDKSMSPDGDDGIWNNTLICYYEGASGGGTPGFIKVFEPEDFRITKITITKGVHKDSTGATGANATKTWNKTTSSVEWDKTTNEAGDKWYNETTIWTSDGHTPGETITLDDSIWGNTWKTSGIGEAFLLLFYVEPVVKEDNLTVVYWDDGNNCQINPNTIQISVKDGVTFVNGIEQTSPVKTGTFTLDDDATIENSVGVKQKFNKTITILDGVAEKYKSGVFMYVGADISNDEKTLTLHYQIDSSKVRAVYVLDFGLPVEIKLSDFVENYSDLVNVTWDENKLKYGELSYDNTNKILTYTPTSIITEQAILDFTLVYKNSTGKIKIGIAPASNVYYEENFFTIPKDSESRWQKLGVSTNKNQTAERLGDSKNNYGYDDAYASDKTYSGGTALKATLTLGMKPIDRPVAKFQFTGTGFDIVSECSNTSGMLYVRVSDADNKTEKLYLIDTYLNGDYEGEDADKTIKNGSTTHQIPVVRCNGVLPYGTHNVSVAGVIIPESGAASVATLGMDDFSMDTTDSIYTLLEELGVTDEEMMDIEFIYMDENSVLNGGTGAGTLSNDSVFNTVSTYASNTQEYYVTIDGFRIYNPLGYENMDANKKLTKSTYDTDEAKLEYVPVYKRLVDETLNNGSVVYMETKTNTSTGDVAADITAYRKLGPYNEIYLKKGSFIAINLGKTTATSVQISAKMLNENADVKEPSVTMLKYSDGGRKAFVRQPITTSTEMYYDVNVVDVNGTKYIIIGNSKENSTGMLSISELKIPADAVLTKATDAEKAYIADAITTMLSAPIDPVDPEPEEPDTFEPDYLYAYTLPVTFRRVGATITVTSSTESGMEVYIKAGENGKVEKLDPINTRMVRWGIADKYIYSFNTGRLTRGEYTYSVYAVMDGVMSTPVPVSFVVW